MSAITNNIAYHTNHGDAPQVPATNTVLKSFSIALHKHWPSSDTTRSNEVLRHFSAALHKHWPQGDTQASPTVMRTMSLGYYGWKYLNGSIAELPVTPPIAMAIHHK